MNIVFKIDLVIIASFITLTIKPATYIINLMLLINVTYFHYYFPNFKMLLATYLINSDIFRNYLESNCYY